MEKEEQVKQELVEKQPRSETEAFAALIKNISQPITESQIIVAKETTKQTEIIAKTTTSLFMGLIGIAFTIVVLAGLALYKGETQLTEKIIIALIGFLGGFGVGKSASR
ncbi:hypothetical protein [Vibrio sp. CAU 1672]|uniref:hypothetical protein n=1 Tax=Vibrio sp. CAU 1672 TaxID=3032594 RepID=UPI0023DB0B1A|nr:hypothetical protein [Vibrio sp. CAU 1672]MDF2156096.1 hypothetical protein [Vibrio sp. CAU 1672]